jgi:hypothetical protein
LKFSFVLILILILAAPANTQGKSDRELDGLVGRVKSVHVETVLMDCESGEFVEVERGTTSEEYDLSGRVKGNRNRFNRSDPISRMLYYPFEEGVNRIEKPTYWEGGIPPFWKHGPLIYTDVYTYDNQNRRAEHVMYKADGSTQSRSIVEFDEHGKIAETKSYNSEGALSDWNIIKYDERGNQVESAHYKADGTLVEGNLGGCSSLVKFVFTYEFDSTGNWVEQVISIPVLRDGRFDLVPYAFKHRTITYY